MSGLDGRSFTQDIHLPGTETASIVPTPQLKQVADGVESLVSFGGVITLDGRPGLGKSAAANLVGYAIDLQKEMVAMPNRPRGKETTAHLYEALTGQRPRMRSITEYELLGDITDLLQGQQVLLAIDEAQHLNSNAFRQLRYLHDRPDSKLVLILIGVGLERHLISACPELDNRVRQRVRFKRYARSDMVRFMQRYHPLFKNTSSDAFNVLLDAINGNLRSCSQVLAAALHDHGTNPERGLTKDEAHAVISTIFGSNRGA